MGVGEEKATDTTGANLDRNLKCPKAMKDALMGLFKQVSFNTDVTSHLNAVGLIIVVNIYSFLSCLHFSFILILAINPCLGFNMYFDFADNPVC